MIFKTHPCASIEIVFILVQNGNMFNGTPLQMRDSCLMTIDS